MFLIFGIPRSGTTHLCYELDSRTREGESVLNEPFHGNRVLRESCSGCPYDDPERAREWIQETPGIRGIKLVSNDGDLGIAQSIHDLFETVVVIRRDLVDIAISLQASRTSGIWNLEDETSKEKVLDRVHVHHETLGIVRDYCRNFERFLEIRRTSGMGGIIEMNYTSQIDIVALAGQLGLSEEPSKNPLKRIRKIRRSESRHDRCANLDYVEAFFSRYDK